MGLYSLLAEQLVAEAAVNKRNESCSTVVQSPVMNAFIENARDDQNIFNSLIEMDFLEAYMDKGLCNLNESEAVNIEQSAVDKLEEKMIASTQRFTDAMILEESRLENALKSVGKNDAQLYAKYGKYLSSPVVKDCPLKGTILKDKAVKAYLSKKKFDYQPVIKQIMAAKAPEQIDNIVEKFIQNVINPFSISCSMKSADVWDKSDRTYVQKVGIAGIKAIGEELKKNYSAIQLAKKSWAVAASNKAEEESKKLAAQLKDAKKAKDPLLVKKLHAAKKVADASNGAYCSYIEGLVVLSKSLMKNYRHVAVAVATWAMKHGAVKESAAIFKAECLAELSDQLVEQAFGE